MINAKDLPDHVQDNLELRMAQIYMAIEGLPPALIVSLLAGLCAETVYNHGLDHKEAIEAVYRMYITNLKHFEEIEENRYVR